MVERPYKWTGKFLARGGAKIFLRPICGKPDPTRAPLVGVRDRSRSQALCPAGGARGRSRLQLAGGQSSSLGGSRAVRLRLQAADGNRCAPISSRWRIELPPRHFGKGRRPGRSAKLQRLIACFGNRRRGYAGFSGAGAALTAAPVDRNRPTDTVARTVVPCAGDRISSSPPS